MAICWCSRIVLLASAAIILFTETGHCMGNHVNSFNQVRSASTNNNVYYSARHVCSQPKQIQRKVETLQTYCKPNYRRVMRRCGYRYCPTFQLIYEIAYRKSYHTVNSVEMKYTCCPGWTRYSIRHTSCMIPQCTRTCQNGGNCVQPEKCSCPEGFTGRECENDVNECSDRTNLCEQKCENTHGSFTCACYHGYQLQTDGKTCKLNIEALPEYVNLKEEYEKLQQQLVAIEKNMTVKPAPNITKLVEKLQQTMALQSVNEKSTVSTTASTTASTTTQTTTTRTTKSPTTTPPTTTAPPTTECACISEADIEEQLTSMSDQIGMMEERLDDCACRSHSARLYEQRQLELYRRGRRRRFTGT